jgi:hypothetical protein
MRVNHTAVDTLSKEKGKWVKCGHRQANCLSKDPNDCFILNLGNLTVVDSYGKPIPLDILSSQFNVLDFDKKNYTTVLAKLYW